MQEPSDRAHPEGDTYLAVLQALGGWRSFSHLRFFLLVLLSPVLVPVAVVMIVMEGKTARERAIRLAVIILGAAGLAVWLWWFGKKVFD